MDFGLAFTPKTTFYSYILIFTGCFSFSSSYKAAAAKGGLEREVHVICFIALFIHAAGLYDKKM